MTADEAHDGEAELEPEPAEQLPAAGNVTEPTVAKSKKPPVQRRSRDYMKPQFIDFESPPLVSLFIRLATGLDSFTAFIEEEYPSVAELPAIDGEAHAAEYVVQLNWGAAE